MATKVLQKTASPGSILVRLLVNKFEALRYLPRIAGGFLKFNSSGELIADQDLTVTGVIVESVDTLSGAGAVSLTSTVTRLTTTGSAQALTLANGTQGQIKRIVHVVDGGSAVLTPTTKTGFTTITFTAVGESATLQYFTTVGWTIVSLNGAVAA